MRVSYAESWKLDAGGGTEELLNNYDEEGQIPVVTKQNSPEGFLSGSDWVYIDGWYYYTKILPAGETTEPVLKSVDFSKLTGTIDENLTDYQNAGYELYFQTEAVQASDELKVSMDAAEELFGEGFVPYETADKKEEMNSETWQEDRLNAYIGWTEEGGN